MIKKTFNVATCLLTAVLLLSSCDPIFDLLESESEYHHAIIYNNSNDTIYMYCNNFSHPDTAFSMFFPNSITFNEICPGESSYMLQNYDKATIDTIMVYIYNDSIIENFTLQEIYEKHIVAARYDLSKSDMRTLNGHICYPPTPAMEGMKMYIPEK